MLVKLEVDWGGTGALVTVLGWVLVGRSMLRSEAEVVGEAMMVMLVGGVF